MGGRAPVAAFKRSSYVVGVRAVCACQRSKALECGLKTRRAHEGSILLYWRSQRALRECDVRAGMAGA
eukprot:3513450-Pleurochrysis_carterae.AAC.2